MEYAVDYDKYVNQGNIITDQITGKSWEATPLQARALDYRDKGYRIWYITDNEASLSSTFFRGWKPVLLTFLLSFLIPVVGTIVWAVWFFCIRPENIKLMWTHQGELVEKKTSLLGGL